MQGIVRPDRHLRTWCAVGVIVALCAFPPHPSYAQDPADAGSANGPTIDRESSDRRITLFMVVKVGDNLTPAQVKQTILDGATITKLSLTDADVSEPRRVPATLFDIVAANTGASGVNTLEASDIDGAVITPLISSHPTWSITFTRNQDRLLKKLDIKVEPNATITLTPGKFEAGDKEWLATIRPGREYILRLPQDVTPREFAMTYTDLEQTPPKEKASSFASWPAPSDDYYMVTISNFPGGDALDRLFDTIKEPSDPDSEAQVPNPFKDIRREMDIRLFLASIGAELPPTDGWDGNRLTLTHATLRKRKPKRVWVYFPIAEDQLQNVVSELSNVKHEEFPDRIRKRQGSDEAGAEVTIEGTTGPKWYEFPLVGDNFQRTFRLKDWSELQKKYPKVYQIAVWEFDSGNVRRPILVEQDGRSSPFKVIEIRNWPRGLTALRAIEENGAEPSAAPDAGQDATDQ